MLTLKRCLLLILLLTSIVIGSQATHLRAGEITVERQQCSALTFKITVTVYTDLRSDVQFGGTEDWLDFGDGTRRLVPQTPSIPRPDLGKDVGIASFSILHTYSANGDYVISYSEQNRNDGVLNMDASVFTPFYLETKISIDPFVGCNNTPQLKIAPIDNACVGAAWSHNPGAFDPDLKDSLSFELVVPFQRIGTPVRNYRDPNNESYYRNFATGNEEQNAEPTFSIGSDGTVVWDAPGSAGLYNIAFHVIEWRKIHGEWSRIGYVRRDMQIVVTACENNRPDIAIPADLCVEAGTIINESIFGFDPDNDAVRIEAVSQIFQLDPGNSPATVQPDDGKFYPQPAELKFEWKTQCSHVQQQPYAVVFKVTDDSRDGANLTTYKTWFIRVIGPKPMLSSVDAGVRAATVKWDPYVCSNADTLEVWRKIDSTPFTPDSCQTGIPASLGYELVALVPMNGGPTTQYFDNNNGKGLAPGAKYCYRIVAKFPSPRGGESYVSDEVCTAPMLIDVPVITNVSVQKTAEDPDGEVFIRWMRPIEVDRDRVPGPLGYKVLRANGRSGKLNLTDVTGNDRILAEMDTVFTDIGGNTRDEIYNYRIVLFSDKQPVDTSAAASTVRLNALAGQVKISLRWDADVPWSNTISTEPNDHEIYRGPALSTESDLILLQAVDPQSGLTFTDEAVVIDQEYCYRVMTRGSYGNPRIGSPLENFSQVICIESGSTNLPCPPVLEVQKTQCETFVAQTECTTSYRNTLTWMKGDQQCERKIIGYKVYRSDKPGGPLTWLHYAGGDEDGIVRDTFFIDRGSREEGLSSMAYCYRITAIDQSGNESDYSNESCNDNCPYYELPNVFSPNGPDNCNRYFSAWRDVNYYKAKGGEGDWHCGEVEQRCARFVKSVDVVIFNRWGKEVYRYKSGSERTIYIDWDGRADDGSELASGIYYYHANVAFDVLDASAKTRSIKGWVHLLR